MILILKIMYRHKLVKQVLACSLTTVIDDESLKFQIELAKRISTCIFTTVTDDSSLMSHSKSKSKPAWQAWACPTSLSLFRNQALTQGYKSGCDQGSSVQFYLRAFNVNITLSKACAKSKTSKSSHGYHRARFMNHVDGLTPF